MENYPKKIWYQGSTMIPCNIKDINKSLNNPGEHYSNLISAYPGITTSELIEQGKDYVIIQTSEGIMRRTNITIDSSEDKIVVKFEEEYEASKLTTHSHIEEKFNLHDQGVELHVVISDMIAPGVLGFFLRNFGSKNIGNGFLTAYKELFNK